MRLLVTGSRTWADHTVVAEAMLDAQGNPPEGTEPGKMTLVHGACPDGADAIADRYARLWRWDVESYPANWRDLGKRAGFVRNQHMINTMPDLALAFIVDGSRGAAHCAGLAEEAGIPVRYYRSTLAEQPISPELRWDEVRGL